MEHKKIMAVITIGAVMSSAVSSLAQQLTLPEPETAAGSYNLPLRFMPYVDLSAVHDSNFSRAAANEESETYYNALAGLSVAYTGSSLDLLLAVFASTRRHSDYSDEDFETIGQGARLRYGQRETIAWEASQSFRRVTDVDVFGNEIAVGNVSPDSVLDNAASTERDIMQATLHAGYDATDKTELDLSYRFDSADYTSDDLVKVTSHTAMLEIASRLTDKSSGILALRAGLQDSEGIDDSADFYAASLGFKTKGTDKLTLKATGGFQQYNRPDDRDAVDSFVFDANASLVASDKVTLRAGARNGVALSSLFAGNGTEFATYYAGAAL
ncbi:MAG: hypothetical protein ACNA71_04105, partial [Kiritimatiellia bacterium]